MILRKVSDKKIHIKQKVNIYAKDMLIDTIDIRVMYSKATRFNLRKVPVQEDGTFTATYYTANNNFHKILRNISQKYSVKLKFINVNKGILDVEGYSVDLVKSFIINDDVFYRDKLLDKILN